MKKVVQTLPYEVFNESEKINQLFNAGLDILHIRKPLFGYTEMKSLINGIDKKFHEKVVIHSNFKLLSKFNLKGIHTDLDELNSFIKRPYFMYLKKMHNISLSVTVSKFSISKIEDDLIDYIFLGPVFQKFSEESIVQKINLFELKNELIKTNKEVFAQGCFNLNNVFTIKASGFSGPVLQSYIWKSGDFLNTFNTFKQNISDPESTVKERKLAM